MQAYLLEIAYGDRMEIVDDVMPVQDFVEMVYRQSGSEEV